MPDRDTQHPDASEVDAIKRLFVRGQAFAVAGRSEEAESLFREALTCCRGAGTAAESRACGNLGTFYGIHGRWFEAVRLYRRGLAIDRARGDWRIVVHHLSNLGAIYAQVGLRSRVPGILGQIDDALDRLDPEDRVRTQPVPLWVRFEDAQGRGDMEDARSLLASVRAAYGEHDDPRVRAAILQIDAALLGSEDQHEAALENLDRALAVPGISPTTELDLLVSRIEALEAAGQAEAAHEAACRALERLEGAGADPLLAEQCLMVGSHLAACFERGGCPPELARRAYDLAASAILERIRQLDACMGDLPELSASAEEDRGWFAEVQGVYAERQRTLLETVAAHLEQARIEGSSPIQGTRPYQDMVRLCAWCSTVRTRGGRWIPVAHFIPAEAGIRVTHSICESCAARLRSERASERPPRPSA